MKTHAHKNTLRALLIAFIGVAFVIGCIKPQPSVYTPPDAVRTQFGPPTTARSVTPEATAAARVVERADVTAGKHADNASRRLIDPEWADLLVEAKKLRDEVRASNIAVAKTLEAATANDTDVLKIIWERDDAREIVRKKDDQLAANQLAHWQEIEKWKEATSEIAQKSKAARDKVVWTIAGVLGIAGIGAIALGFMLLISAPTPAGKARGSATIAGGIGAMSLALAFFYRGEQFADAAKWGSLVMVPLLFVVPAWWMFKQTRAAKKTAELMGDVAHATMKGVELAKQSPVVTDVREFNRFLKDAQSEAGVRNVAREMVAEVQVDPAVSSTPSETA